MVKLGLIGCGYWGPNLLRNFYGLSNCRMKMVAELDDSRLKYIHENYPSVNTTRNYKEILTSDIEAVVIGQGLGGNSIGKSQ